MRPILFTLLLAAAGASGAVGAQHHEHAPPPAAGAASTPAPAERYATDEPLRRNMAGIRTAVDALGHAELGHLDAAQVEVLAGRIGDHVREIIATCKLPPDADAALHGIIAPLMQQSQALQANPGDLAPVASLRAALADYARLFDDPAATAH